MGFQVAQGLVQPTVVSNTTLVGGQYVFATPSAPLVLTLPGSPGTGLYVGVRAGAGASGVNQIIITTSGGSIFGPGCYGAASIALGTPGASILLLSHSGQWHVVGGQQDTGWVAPTLSANVTAGTPAPFYRQIGSVVRLRGNVVTSGTATGPWITGLPTPISTATLVADFSTGIAGVIMNSAGLGVGSLGSGVTVVLDGLGYTVD